MSPPTRDEFPMEPKELGKYLRNARNANQLTLRAVEEMTKGVVKNSYLSQIENGQISLPSPAILWELSEAYGVDYGDLLVRAGHRIPEQKVSSRQKAIAGLPLHALEDLDEDDRQELISYLGYLRNRKKGG